MTRIYAALECITLAVAFFAVGGVTHLTWWNVALFVLCDIVYIYDSQSDAYERVWQAFATLSALVQLTVILMSFLGCSMIRDALSEVGPWLYYFGNFVLHYWPSLRAAAMRPRVSGRHVYYDAARIVAVYATLNQPERVYSCSMISSYVVMPLGIVTALAIEWIIRYIASSNEPMIAMASYFFAR